MTNRPAPLVGAFVVGTLVGAGLAILWNTPTGRRWRDHWRERVREAEERLRDLTSRQAAS